MTYNTSAFNRFLNREDEINVFKNLLIHEQHRILLIHGLAGMGKTALLHRLYELCRALNVLAVRIDFRSPRLRQKEPDEVIHVLGERIGQSFAGQLMGNELPFQPLHTLSGTDLGRQTQGNGSDGTGASFFGDIRVNGDFVVRDKVTYDLNITHSTIIVEPGRALFLADSHREKSRNDAFRTALTTLVAKRRVALFFDHYEDATDRVSQWLQEQLLTVHLERLEQFANLWIIIGGSKVPLQDEVDQWLQVLHQQQVGPLSDKLIYLFCAESWGLEEQVIEVLIKSSKRNTKHLFLNLRNYLEESASEEKGQ